MRFVSNHPLLTAVAAVLAIGGIGLLVDSLGGSSGSGAPLCGDSAGGGPGETREQRDARVAYLSVWTRAAAQFGSAGEPPPRIAFTAPGDPKPGPNAVMWVGPGADDCRTIFATPTAARGLARAEGGRRVRRAHRTAERWSLHETAHYFQSDEVLFNDSLREYGATQWEKAHSRKILGTNKRKVYARFNRWRDRDQFGDNFGGNPLTFVWPGAPIEPSTP